MLRIPNARFRIPNSRSGRRSLQFGIRNLERGMGFLGLSDDPVSRPLAIRWRGGYLVGEGGLVEEERGDEPEGQECADAPAGVGDVPGAIAILDEELDVEPVLPGLLEERLELVELALL